jgi:hypothetical protein
VSVLNPGDEDIHYSDNSHRWISPDPARDKAWKERVQAHLDAHLAGADEPRRARVPSQRRPT